LDLCDKLEKLNNNISSKKKEKCKEIVIPCETAGFALNWNPNKIGELITGDARGIISVYNNNENYTQWAKTSEYSYHKGSVEDIIFSPEQSFVFASCISFTM
jgi:ribosome assembly protein RRB1